MLDMGPYYVTALVNILGPVKRVAAITTKAFEERVAHESNRVWLTYPCQNHDPTSLAHLNSRTARLSQ